MIKVHQFEDQIREIENQPAETGNVLLYGSSFFAFWGYDRAREQLLAASQGAVRVSNHGFGGATVTQLLYHYHRLVRPYDPAAIVFRTGHNDVGAYSPQDAAVQTQLLFDWVKNDYPQIPLIALKAFDTPSALPENLEKIHIYNAMLDQMAQKDPQLKTLDLNPFFYTEEGTFRDVFREDGLHLTDSGYQQMAEFLAPKIAQFL